MNLAANILFYAATMLEFSMLFTFFGDCFEILRALRKKKISVLDRKESGYY